MNDFTDISSEINFTLKLTNEGKSIEAYNLIQDLVKNKENLLNNENWKLIGHLSLALGNVQLAKVAYTKSNNLESLSFVQILLNELDNAKDILSNLNESPASLWCNYLIELFLKKQKITKMPTFFIIRHFMEFTVYYLLLSKNQMYLDLLVNNIGKLLPINTDSEKLIGYAYLNYGDLDNAVRFLNNSLKREKFDGEAYYKLGKIYYMKGLYQDSLAMLHNAQIILPEHYPAKELMEKVLLKLSQK